MRKWLYLGGAIASEVTATMLLRATVDNPAWTSLVVLGYVLAFFLLGLTLRLGMPIGVAYGIWTAAGIALIALLARAIWREPLTKRMLAGIAVIAVGVVLIELG